MQDANASRFALLLGRPDWGGCTLHDAGALATASLAALWADPALRSASPLTYDGSDETLTLSRRVARFRAAAGDTPPSAALRLGAAADAHGNIYALADGGAAITVRSAGSGGSSAFWPAAASAAAGPGPASGGFAPGTPAAPPPPLRLHGLAVTAEHFLVAGRRPAADGSGAGLLVFDLLGGGPPLTLGWPAGEPFEPHDLAPRPGGGLAVLDRRHARVWLLDRRLGMHAVVPVAGATDSGFEDADAAAAAASPPDSPPAPLALQPWFDLVANSAGGTDPVAVDVLPDDRVLVIDGAGSDGFALVSLYAQGQLAGRASTIVARDVIAAEDAAGFVLRGFDAALQAVPAGAPPRLVVVSHEGNQAIAFDLVQDAAASPAPLVLDPVEGFLPMRRYGGQRLVRDAAASVPGDTGLRYLGANRWLPLMEQRRPRYQPQAALLTPLLDGAEPALAWHRVMIDGCIPAGCSVRVASRSADDADLLAQLPFTPQPTPLLRPDGGELPWLLDGPGANTGATRGTGCWELLLQRVQGRWLQLRLELIGNELATPRLAALRVWRPRFSYLRYLPALYREDAGSADFLERFLANFEGSFTALEDRIAGAAALFDVRSAPADTLDWLAGWLGLVLDPALGEARRRQLIAHAMPLYRYRGTPQALRLALTLAMSECVAEADFNLPAPSQRQPWGVRLVERFLTRRLPVTLLGETVAGTGPRLVEPGARWSPAEGAEGLHRRWREWLTAAGVSGVTAALFTPAAPAVHRDHWARFCLAELGAVPGLAGAFAAAWATERARLALAPRAVPAAWAELDGEAEQQAWRDFLAALSAPLRRWLARWQGFVARRHLRPAELRVNAAIDWPEFALLPPHTTLPDNLAALADWALFETRLEPMAALAHSFSVLLPSSGPLADAATLAQAVDLATRVVALEKPAHTRFDVKPYWALFRLGQVRLGLDTLLGRGGREPALAPALRLGVAGPLGAGRLAPPPDAPADRVLLAC
ncbi:MAG: hypothetical protein C0505_04020 [Leptothrix sp. (in: Bacteria)]|nr:hypothetical protein [Leptothrix sp. (in: b-proteobacteria)]